MEKIEETGERPTSRTRDEVIKEAKRIEEDALVTSKGHFVAAHFWSFSHYLIGIPVVILSAIAATPFVAKGGNESVTGIIFSVIIAALSGVMTFLNPNQKSSTHLNAGNNYDSLKNKIRMFWSIDCWKEDSDGVLTERLTHFSDQKDKLNQGSPQPPWWGYWLAKRGIKKGEATHQVDLPKKPLNEKSEQVSPP